MTAAATAAVAPSPPSSAAALPLPLPAPFLQGGFGRLLMLLSLLLSLPPRLVLLLLVYTSSPFFSPNQPLYPLPQTRVCAILNINNASIIRPGREGLREGECMPCKCKGGGREGAIFNRNNAPNRGPGRVHV